MIIGTVTGEIYSTINHPFYDGRKLLIVEKDSISTRKDYLVAVDNVGAGIGQRVLVLDEGNGGRQVFASDNAPVRSVIVGIIDQIEASHL